MRELCFANECLPEDRRVRKRLGSGSAWIAKPGKTGQNRARPGKARQRQNRCLPYGSLRGGPPFFEPNRCFWLRRKSQKHRQTNPSGTPTFVEKVGRCVQISLAFRFSFGARLSCRKNSIFPSRLFRLLDVYVVYV